MRLKYYLLLWFLPSLLFTGTCIADLCIWSLLKLGTIYFSSLYPLGPDIVPGYIVGIKNLYSQNLKVLTEPGLVGSNLGSSPYSLCDLGEVT